MIPPEALSDIERDAEWTAAHVGAPGCPARVRAEAVVRLVREYREARQTELDYRLLGELESTFTRAAKLVDQLSVTHAEWCPLESVTDPEHPRPCRCHAPVVAALRAMFLEVP